MLKFLYVNFWSWPVDLVNSCTRPAVCTNWPWHTLQCYLQHNKNCRGLECWLPSSDSWLPSSDPRFQNYADYHFLSSSAVVVFLLLTSRSWSRIVLRPSRMAFWICASVVATTHAVFMKRETPWSHSYASIRTTWTWRCRWFWLKHMSETKTFHG